ncbi:hypothetical protein NDU88_001592 [Pleurodeles waltl]|uniref:Uncharacterized protein n=1 Tax=Pleurodeles waltl TaxID=8319 RepID=A0AAV7U7F9_PLEWA|nr:hypothetical protein NDU88_001592 [Pleurodeles waltl]
MSADPALRSYAKTPLLEGALQQHSTDTSGRPLASSRPPLPAGFHQSTNQSHLLSEVIRCQPQLGSPRARLHHQAARAQAPPEAPALQGPQGHEGRKVHRGRGPIQPPIRPPRRFLAPCTTCSPGAALRKLPALRSARPQLGPPRESGPQHQPRSRVSVASKMTVGLTRCRASVRSSQHRLQEK